MTHSLRHTIFMVASLSLASACGVDATQTDNPDPGGGSTAGGQDTTFDHDNSGVDPFDLIDKLAVQGPPRYTSHVHSCPKVRYRTFGNVLTALGVNVANTTALSAGQLYTSGDNALGAPNYANRIRENLGVTTSGASREFDIFAAAADEITAAVPTLTRCQVNGVGAQLFDGSNACNAGGITCLIGQPATLGHIEFCNLTVRSAANVATGKRIAIAALLAAAYTCE